MGNGKMNDPKNDSCLSRFESVWEKGNVRVIVTPDVYAPWHSDATPLVLGGSAPLRPPALPTPASVGAWAHIITAYIYNSMIIIIQFIYYNNIDLNKFSHNCIHCEWILLLISSNCQNTLKAMPTQHRFQC